MHTLAEEWKARLLVLILNWICPFFKRRICHFSSVIHHIEWKGDFMINIKIFFNTDIKYLTPILKYCLTCKCFYLLGFFALFSNIMVRFGSFLASFQQKVVWPNLVDFGYFSNDIWLWACAGVYQPWDQVGVRSYWSHLQWRHRDTGVVMSSGSQCIHIPQFESKRM